MGCPKRKSSKTRIETASIEELQDAILDVRNGNPAKQGLKLPLNPMQRR